jgi:hypothetical protein
MAGQKGHNTGLKGHSTCSSRLFNCPYKGLILILIAMRREQITSKLAILFTDG